MRRNIILWTFCCFCIVTTQIGSCQFYYLENQRLANFKQNPNLYLRRHYPQLAHYSRLNFQQCQTFSINMFSLIEIRFRFTIMFKDVGFVFWYSGVRTILHINMATPIYYGKLSGIAWNLYFPLLIINPSVLIWDRSLLPMEYSVDSMQRECSQTWRRTDNAFVTCHIIR